MIIIAILIFSIVAHELAHGYAAYAMGDNTARASGRLTINPLAHIDVFGSILVPFLTFLGGIPFGWAKPVPYNPYNLSDQRFGAAKVAIAGPLTNLAIAIVFALLMGPAGSLFPGAASALFMKVIAVNVSLAIFNLCPVPPLDGFTVLAGILPQRHTAILHTLERYSLPIIIGFVLLIDRTGLLDGIIAEIIYLLVK